MALQEIESTSAHQVEEADDVCALPLVRRLGATLDIDPARWREGDPLPRGWHLALFTVDTRQSLLRADGMAGLGVKLPDLGLPRVMVAGRRIRFHGDIPIGARVRRVSRLVSVVPKHGRSGRFALTTAQHEIFVGDSRTPAVVEVLDHVMREAAEAAPGGQPAAPAAPSMPAPERRRIVTPDETLLFRVSAIMFNPHRIHYDLPYATGKEGYPALVVNGSVSSLLLLEFFRTEARREPKAIALRNVGPAYCGRRLRLNAVPGEREWRVWADDDEGRVTVEGTME